MYGEKYIRNEIVIVNQLDKMLPQANLNLSSKLLSQSLN